MPYSFPSIRVDNWELTRLTYTLTAFSSSMDRVWIESIIWILVLFLKNEIVIQVFNCYLHRVSDYLQSWMTKCILKEWEQFLVGLQHLVFIKLQINSLPHPWPSPHHTWAKTWTLLVLISASAVEYYCGLRNAADSHPLGGCISITGEWSLCAQFVKLFGLFLVDGCYGDNIQHCFIISQHCRSLYQEEWWR